MAMKFRIYRRYYNKQTHRSSWEYICSSNKYSSRYECLSEFAIRFPQYMHREIRVEDARYFGYYIED